jgi:Domain of unknown function (DUF397)
VRLFARKKRTIGPGSDEPAQNWRKSSHSYANGGCVEAACLSRELIGVRDSKHPRGSVLRFTSAEWSAFLGDVRDGAFDRRESGPRSATAPP